MGYTTHATLLARLTDGIDPTAWREFHDRYADLIREFARRRGLQPADCDDVAQEVLLSLTRSMKRFDYDSRKGKFRSYLKTTTEREISRKLRQNKNNRTLGDPGLVASEVVANPAEDAIWEEEWRRYHVRTAMRRLESEINERNRRAFTLYAMQGRPAAVIAEALEMSIDQVYQAKSRVLRRLSELIKEQIDDEG